MNLDSIFNEVIAALGANTKAQVDIKAQQKGLATESIDLARDAIPSAVNVSQQALQGNYEAQEAGIATRQALGNDISDPNSLLSIMVQDFREVSTATQAQRAKVTQLSSTSLFDDPLQYLFNQVLLPDEQNKLAALENQADSAAKTIQNMQALTTASAQAAKATARTITTQSMADAAKVQIADLTAKVNAAQIESLGYDSEGIKLMQESNEKLLHFKAQQHQMALAEQAAARASEIHGMQLEKFRQESIEETQYLQIINAGRALAEQAPLDMTAVKMMFKSPAQKAQLDTYFDAGTNYAATGSKTLGDTPGQAIVNTLSVNGLRGEQNKPARDFLSGVFKDAISAYQTKTGKMPKDTPQDKAELAKYVDEILYGPVNQKTGKRMETQGLLYKNAANAHAANSIYKAPDLPQLAAYPAVQSNILYEPVIKPMLAAGLTTSEPKAIYAQAAELVKRGQLTNNQLVEGISSLYKDAAIIAYYSKGLSKFGLPYRPSYVAEGTPITWGPAAGLSTDMIDWSNPVSVQAYRVNELSADFAKGFKILSGAQ